MAAKATARPKATAKAPAKAPTKRRTRKRGDSLLQIPIPDVPPPMANDADMQWAERIEAMADYWESLCDEEKADRERQYKRLKRMESSAKPPKAPTNLDENGLPKVVTFAWLFKELERVKKTVPDEELEEYVVKAIAWALRRKFTLPKAKYQRIHLHETIDEYGMAATIESVRSLFINHEGVANVWAVVRYRARAFAGGDA